MGFFKAVCNVCEKEVGLNRFKIADGWICPDCLKRFNHPMATPIWKVTSAEIKAYLAENPTPSPAANPVPIVTATADEEIDDDETTRTVVEFTPTKTIGEHLQIDEARKRWRIPEYAIFSGKEKDTPIYSFDDLIDYEFWVDEELKTRGSERAMARNANGILVSFDNDETVQDKTVVETLEFRVFVNNPDEPKREIHVLLCDETKAGTEEYAKAYAQVNALLSVFDQILNINNSKNNLEIAVTAQAPQAAPVSTADEILKFKSLLDSGVITQEEFEAKKKQLLGL